MYTIIIGEYRFDIDGTHFEIHRFNDGNPNKRWLPVLEGEIGHVEDGKNLYEWLCAVETLHYLCQQFPGKIGVDIAQSSAGARWHKQLKKVIDRITAL